MLVLFLILIPAATCILVRTVGARSRIEFIHICGVILTFLLAAAVGVRGSVDELSKFMVGIIAFVAAVAGFYSIGYIRQEFGNERVTHTRLFYTLFHLFVATMLLAVTTDNLGLMWVAIEGTTLATVFLVNLHNNATGLEAAYKYLIISSVGIALAFLGTVLMYYAAVGQTGEIGLSWTTLIGIAAHLNPRIVKLAFAFVLIGYGTKAGLAPMHRSEEHTSELQSHSFISYAV